MFEQRQKNRVNGAQQLRKALNHAQKGLAFRKMIKNKFPRYAEEITHQTSQVKNQT
jgi:hypothetical protein